MGLFTKTREKNAEQKKEDVGGLGDLGVVNEDEQLDAKEMIKPVVTAIDDATGRVKTLSKRVTFSMGDGSEPVENIPEELAEALAEFDIEGDGNVDKDTLVRAAAMYREAKDSRKRLQRLAVALSCIVVALFGIMFGLTYAVVEISKVTGWFRE